MSKLHHATPAIPLTLATQPGTSTLTVHHSLQSQAHISPNLPSPAITQSIPGPSLTGGNLPNPTIPRLTGHSSRYPTSSSTPSIKSIWAARIAECLTFANGIGMASLILALAFGVGAWVGMNMQYKQGEKSLELTIWATCADHENIQQTQLCKDIMSKNFNEFHTRSLDPDSIRSSDVTMRSLLDEVIRSAEQNKDGSTEPRMNQLLSSLSESERSLILLKPSPGETSLFPSTEMRATLFPLVDLLYTPIRLVFSLIEGILITIVYSIHRVFSWLSRAVWFLFQLFLYSMVESIAKQIFSAIESVIISVLPGWFPSIFISGTVTAVVVSALKSYWYGISFTNSLKWILITRVGLWAGVQLIYFLIILFNTWKERRRRKD